MALVDRLRERFGRIDAVLAICGFVGLLLLLFLGPRLHPDAGVVDHIPRAEAIERARTFAEAVGRLDLENATAEASVHRRGAYLDSLQRRYGRPELIRRLRGGNLPAYVWEITWSAQVENETEELVRVELDLSGNPIGIATESRAITAGLRHEEALATALLRQGSRDSIPAGPLAFRFDNTAGEQAESEAVPGRSDPNSLGASDVVALARYHLAQTGLGDRATRIDSVFVSSEEGFVTATVQVSAESEDPDRWVEAGLEMLANGPLLRLEPRFHRSAESTSEFSGEQLIEISSVFLFALLGLILVIVFFRRISARLIDTRAAIRDGMVGGAAAGLAMSTEIISTEAPGTTVEIVVIAVGTVLMAFAAAGFMFFISGAATSVARDRWEEHLRPLDLARQFYIRNVPVGRALVRGAMAGLALIGLGILALLVFPRVAIHISNNGGILGGQTLGFAALQAIGGKFFFALFATYTVVMGLGSLLRVRTRSVAFATVVSVLLLGLIGISPLDLRPLGVELALSVLMAVVITWLFWRFDALSAIAAFFVLHLAAAALPGLSIPGSTEMLNAFGILLVVVILFVLGGAGVLSERNSQEVPHIVPEYVEELAQRERLKRELELAREVQLSFLPARSPDYAGLDIASVCLPANEVGGDYYDFFQMDGRKLGVVVGDVSGKGMQAAFYMTLMKGILQSMSTSLFGPAEILSKANELFRMNAPRGAFMSMIFGLFDTTAGTWTFARAGHNPVLVHRAAADRPEVIKPSGAAIGLASGSIFSSSLEEKTVPLNPGDLLLIYTDGITEAMDENRSLYDENRLEDVVARSRGRSAEDVVSAIIEDVEAFRGTAPRHDDMTMVAVRVTGD